ncbi:MAG TPA: Asp23/Gls24 family envelope stress response protein [Candidatus Dormibacteraeota bacterium]|nr:Asp23/Gls24 family envelope stress response protein [Candidatus Dormibacteraeota bacterium]
MPSNRPLLQTHALGTVEVSPRVVAMLTAKAAGDCYGIVGMSARGLRDGLAELLNRNSAERGIELRVLEDGLGIDLYVIVDHGVRILEVAHNLMSAVAYSLEHHLGLKVLEVNVNVQGVRPPEEQDGRS